MCGIIYVRRLDGKWAGHAVEKRYRNQQYRGREGFGYVAIGRDTAAVARAETEANILQKLTGERTSEILFHHRQPTSTPNLIDSTHPIVVAHDALQYRYYLVHNGIISNSDALKKDHEQQGFRYTTTVTKKLITKNYRYTSHFHNDSEALAIDLALTLEERQAETAARGSVAFVMLQTDRQDRPRALFYGRNHGNPLVVQRHAELVAITSENPYGVTLKADTLYRYDYRSGTTTEQPFRVGEYGYNLCGFQWESFDEWDGTDSMSGKIRELERTIAEYREYIKVAQQAGEREEAADLRDELVELEQELEFYRALAA